MPARTAEFVLRSRRNITTPTSLGKFRRSFLHPSFPALRQQGVLRFVLLGRPSGQRALPCVRCGVLRGAPFGSPSVLYGVSCVPPGGRSAAIAALPDDSLVLYDAWPVLLASVYGACFPP